MTQDADGDGRADDYGAAGQLRFDEFPIPTTEEWRQAAVDSLDGRPFEKLIGRTYEGIPLQPMYRAEDAAGLTHAHTLPGRPPFVRGRRAAGYLAQPWAVAQEIPYGEPQAFNRALRHDLERGQTAVNLLLDGPTRAGLDPDQARPGQVGYGGVSLATVEDVAAALAGVDLEKTPLFIRAGTVALPLLALLVAYLRRQGKSAAVLQGCLEDDPLGVLAHEGTLPLSLERAYDEMAQLMRWAAGEAPQLATAAVHTYPYHNAGANAVQDLAFALATGVEYLRALAARGVDVETAAPRLRFDFAVGGQFFMEVARLRAARLLWAQVGAAFGGSEAAQAMRIHARTARYNKTGVDPYVNMLRVTTEALAAAVGMADSLHVAPFDEPLRPPDEFSRRIARNVQTILQEEAHLTRLIDPAGGSWYVEALTDRLARDAWALFQEIERRGGMAAALRAGYPQAQIAAVVEQRAANLAKRRDVLVGVNQYANPAEKPLPADGQDYEALYRERAAQMAHHRTSAAARRHDDDPATHTAALQRVGVLLEAPPEEMIAAAVAAAAAGATLNEITRALRLRDGAQPVIIPVPLRRAAEPFEALRRRADEYAADHGKRPQVFLANMGPLRRHKARADFAQGFFEVGGFEILNSGGFDSPEQAATAALASGAPAVVICSTDETYPEIVPPLAARIKAAAPRTAVVLAGYPKEQVEVHRAAGVDEFIFFGADCLALNEWLLDAITGSA